MFPIVKMSLQLAWIFKGVDALVSTVVTEAGAYNPVDVDSDHIVCTVCRQLAFYLVSSVVNFSFPLLEIYFFYTGGFSHCV